MQQSTPLSADEIDDAFGADAPIAREFIAAIKDDTLQTTTFPADFFERLVTNPRGRAIITRQLPQSVKQPLYGSAFYQSIGAFEEDVRNTSKSEYQVVVGHNQFISAMTRHERTMALVDFPEHVPRLQTIFEYSRIYTLLQGKEMRVRPPTHTELFDDVVRYGITEDIYAELQKRIFTRTDIREFYKQMAIQNVPFHSVTRFAHAILPRGTDQLVPFCAEFFVAREFLAHVNDLQKRYEKNPPEFIVMSCALFANLTDAQYRMLHAYVPAQLRGVFSFYGDLVETLERPTPSEALVFDSYPGLDDLYATLIAGETAVNISGLDSKMYTAVLQRLALEGQDEAAARLAQSVHQQTQLEYKTIFVMDIPHTFPLSDVDLREKVHQAIRTVNGQASGEKDLSVFTRFFSLLDAFDMANVCDRLSERDAPHNLRLNYLHYLYDILSVARFAEFCTYCPIEVILELRYALNWISDLATGKQGKGLRVASTSSKTRLFNDFLILYFRAQIRLRADVVDQWQLVRKSYVDFDEVKEELSAMDALLLPPQLPPTPVMLPESPLSAEPLLDLVPLLDLDMARKFTVVYPTLVPFSELEVKKTVKTVETRVFDTAKFARTGIQTKVEGYSYIFVTPTESHERRFYNWASDTKGGARLRLHIDKTSTHTSFVILPVSDVLFLKLRSDAGLVRRRPANESDDAELKKLASFKEGVRPSIPRKKQILVIERTGGPVSSPITPIELAFLGDVDHQADFVKYLTSTDYTETDALERYGDFVGGLTQLQLESLRTTLTEGHAARLSSMIDFVEMKKFGFLGEDLTQMSLFFYAIKHGEDEINVVLKHGELLSKLSETQRSWLRSRLQPYISIDIVLAFARVYALFRKRLFDNKFPDRDLLRMVKLYGLQRDFLRDVRNALSTPLLVAQFYYEMERRHVSARRLEHLPLFIRNRELEQNLLPAELPAFCAKMESVVSFVATADQLRDDLPSLRFLLLNFEMLENLNTEQFSFLLFCLPAPLRPRFAKAFAVLHKSAVVTREDPLWLAELEAKIVDRSAKHTDCAVLTQPTYSMLRDRLLQRGGADREFFVALLRETIDAELSTLRPLLVQNFSAPVQAFIAKVNEEHRIDEKMFEEHVYPLEDNIRLDISDRITDDDMRRTLRVWTADQYWPGKPGSVLAVCREINTEDVLSFVFTIKEEEMAALDRPIVLQILHEIVLFSFGVIVVSGEFTGDALLTKWTAVKTFVLALDDQAITKEVADIQSLMVPSTPVEAPSPVPPTPLDVARHNLSPVEKLPDEVLPDPSAGPFVYVKDFLAYIQTNCPAFEPKSPQICDALGIDDAMLDKFVQEYKDAASTDDEGMFNKLRDKTGAETIVALLRAHLPLVCAWGNETFLYWLLRLVSLLLFFPVTLIFNIVFNGAQRNRSHTPFYHCMLANNPFLYKARMLVTEKFRARPASTKAGPTFYTMATEEERQELLFDDGGISLCGDTSVSFSYSKPARHSKERSTRDRKLFVRETDPEKKYTYSGLKSEKLFELWRFVQDLDLWWWQRFQLNPTTFLSDTTRIKETLRLGICNAGALWLPDLFGAGQPPVLSSLVLYHAANRGPFLAEWLANRRISEEDPDRDYQQFLTKVVIPLFSSKGINTVFALFLLPIATIACRSKNVATYILAAEKRLPAGVYWIGRHRMDGFPLDVPPYFSYFSLTNKSIAKSVPFGFYQHRLNFGNVQNVTIRPPSGYKVQYVDALSSTRNQWFDSAAFHVEWEELVKDPEKKQGNIIKFVLRRATQTDSAQIQNAAQLVRCYLRNDVVVNTFEKNIGKGTDASIILNRLHGKLVDVSKATEMVQRFARQLPPQPKPKRLAEEPLEPPPSPSVRGVFDLEEFKVAVSDMMRSAHRYGTPYFVWQRFLEILEPRRPRTALSMMASKLRDPDNMWVTAFGGEFSAAQREFGAITSNEMLLRFFGVGEETDFNVFRRKIVERILARLDLWQRLVNMPKVPWTSREIYDEMTRASAFFTKPEEGTDVYAYAVFSKTEIDMPDGTKTTVKQAMDELLKSLDVMVEVPGNLPAKRMLVERLLFAVFKLQENKIAAVYVRDEVFLGHLISVLCFFCKNVTESVIRFPETVLSGKEVIVASDTGFSTAFAEVPQTPVVFLPPGDVPMPAPPAEEVQIPDVPMPAAEEVQMPAAPAPSVEQDVLAPTLAFSVSPVPPNTSQSSQSESWLTQPSLAPQSEYWHTQPGLQSQGTPATSQSSQGESWLTELGLPPRDYSMLHGLETPALEGFTTEEFSHLLSEQKESTQAQTQAATLLPISPPKQLPSVSLPAPSTPIEQTSLSVARRGSSLSLSPEPGELSSSSSSPEPLASSPQFYSEGPPRPTTSDDVLLADIKYAAAP